MPLLTIARPKKKSRPMNHTYISVAFAAKRQESGLFRKGIDFLTQVFASKDSGCRWEEYETVKKFTQFLNSALCFKFYYGDWRLEYSSSIRARANVRDGRSSAGEVRECAGPQAQNVS